MAPLPDREWSLTAIRAALVPLGFSLGLAILAGITMPGQALLLRACWGAAATIALLTLIQYLRQRHAGTPIALGVAVYRHHWVQALAQLTVYAWWGWHVRIVYAFVPLLLAQILFAYAIDALLGWWRRGRLTLGFGPLPVIGSINLFLWFRPEWFYWQFALIALGYAGKELIRWERDGRSTHIFNPSSFPLAVSSLVLIAFGASDLTFGSLIANTQHDPPLIYLVIFLAALPGQWMFGVARMTLSAVVTMVAFGLAYFLVTGTYFFYDSFIPVPVFLGMHLLFTDPSTSPRSERGRVAFGVLYALGTLALYVVLTRTGVPTFYDKLLPVPLMNLAVRALDRWGRAPTRVRRDTPPWSRVSVSNRHRAWTVAWVVVFLGLSAGRVLGDRHPGQYLPFWVNACQAGSTRACNYASFLTLTYCNNGSGWACNEVAVQRARAGQSPGPPLSRACDLGFAGACENMEKADPRDWVRGAPSPLDLPIVLRGTKPALSERDPARLMALACAQGWPGACAE